MTSHNSPHEGQSSAMAMHDQEADQEIDLENPPFPITAIDRGLLAMRDEDFHPITWSDLQQIISNNSLEELKRRPSDLRRYLAWSHHTKQNYGDIRSFVIQERLRWTPLPDEPGQTSTAGEPRFAFQSSIPFTDRADYAVLSNDWPYGFAPGIHHLLVWTKTPIAVDAVRGEGTAESRAVIDDFVQRFFTIPLGAGGADKVLWFKNWVALQSVPGLDHIHVLVRDVDPGLLKEWLQRRDI